MSLPPADPLRIAVRGYVATGDTMKPPGQLAADEPSPWIVIFDTETSTDAAQILRFGTYQVRHLDRDGSVEETGLFYDPESLSAEETALLLRYAAERGLKPCTRGEFVENVFFGIGYDLRATIAGFNLPFDLSRLAIGHDSARGKTMRGGFSLQLSPDPRRARIQVKHLSRRAALIRFTAPARQRSTEGQQRRGIPTPIRRGFFVDVKTLAAALTGETHSLESLGTLLGIPHPKTAAAHGETLSEAYLDYALNDVQATWECLAELKGRYERHGLAGTPVHRIYSEASLGKAYLREMGIRPWRLLQPGFPDELMGLIMSSYYGGRSEVHLRREVTRVLYCDFLSMYPTVCALMGLWSFVTARGVDWRETTAETASFLEAVTLADLQQPATFRRLPTLVRIRPAGDLLPVRAQYEPEPQYTIGLNFLTCDSPLWYTLADCMASKLLTGKPPTVLQALSFAPEPPQSGLSPVSLAGNPDCRIDPYADDFYRRLIDLRKDIQKREPAASELEAERLRSAQQALKILANASSYGIFVEINVEEREDAVKATCYGPEGKGFPVSVRKIEAPGTYFHPLLGSLITGAARLMLAVTERLALDAGLDWAFCDTDSMAFAKPGDMPEAEFLNRALSVREWFTPLNPYAQKGALLKIEPANYGLKDRRTSEEPVPLYAYAISSKRYALFNRDHHGRPILRKASAHGLGHLLPPGTESDLSPDIPPPALSLAGIGVERWQYDLWYRLVEAVLRGHPDRPNLADLTAFDQPAVSRYAATTPKLLRWFKSYNCGKPYREQVRPFNFLLAYQTRLIAEEPDTGSTRHTRKRSAGLNLPRVISPYERDPARVLTLCFDRDTGQRISGDRLKTYRQALARYPLHPEEKFLGGDYTDRGPTRRRHIMAIAVRPIGKEANRWEEQFYLGLDPEAQVEYGLTPDEAERARAHQRAMAKAVGVGRLAEQMGISRRQLSNILHGNANASARSRAPFGGVFSER